MFGHNMLHNITVTCIAISIRLYLVPVNCGVIPHVNNPPFRLTSCITRCSCLEVLKVPKHVRASQLYIVHSVRNKLPYTAVVFVCSYWPLNFDNLTWWLYTRLNIFVRLDNSKPPALYKVTYCNTLIRFGASTKLLWFDINTTPTIKPDLSKGTAISWHQRPSGILLSLGL
jgi:hypothetical protein